MSPDIGVSRPSHASKTSAQSLRGFRCSNDDATKRRLTAKSLKLNGLRIRMLTCVFKQEVVRAVSGNVVEFPLNDDVLRAKTLEKSLRVLVADDSATMRTIVCGMLRALGYQDLFEASDGHSALSLLERFPAGLVISDWQMSSMDGLELLASIEIAYPAAAIPFILMTSAAADLLKDSRRKAIPHYLIKPFDCEQLARKIMEAIANSA